MGTTAMLPSQNNSSNDENNTHNNKMTKQQKHNRPLPWVQKGGKLETPVTIETRQSKNIRQPEK